MALHDMTPRQQAILDTFDYHRPGPEASKRIERNRFAFKLCALTVLENTPEGADQTAALRQLHEAMMTANKSIVCDPAAPSASLPPSDLSDVLGPIYPPGQAQNPGG